MPAIYWFSPNLTFFVLCASCFLPPFSSNWAFSCWTEASVCVSTKCWCQGKPLVSFEGGEEEWKWEVCGGDCVSVYKRLSWLFWSCTYVSSPQRLDAFCQAVLVGMETQDLKVSGLDVWCHYRLMFYLIYISIVYVFFFFSALVRNRITKQTVCSGLDKTSQTDSLAGLQTAGYTEGGCVLHWFPAPSVGCVLSMSTRPISVHSGSHDVSPHSLPPPPHLPLLLLHPLCISYIARTTCGWLLCDHMSEHGTVFDCRAYVCCNSDVILF